METIQIKTIDPVSQELLKSAYEHGLELHWDRYDKLQPQDGFLRVGLSCPYGCMQGPCRIDPFGRGAERGLCGLNREVMVAALFLRLTLQGAMEAVSELTNPERTSEIFWAAPLVGIASQAMENLGGGEISLEEISRASFLLQRPWESVEGLIHQALRLGLLTLGLLEKRKPWRKTARSLGLKVGYGLLAGKEVIIGVSGQPSRKFVETLCQEMSREFPGSGQIVSLGCWFPLDVGFLPCVCTSGEGELLLTSGKINLLIAGPGIDPGLAELCQELEIPLLFSQNAKEAGELLHLAWQKAKASSRIPFSPDPSFLEEAEVIMTFQELGKIFKKSSAKKLALLCGADTPQQPLGWIPAEVASTLQGEGFLVAGWGDAALWLVKKGLASQVSNLPVCILDEQQSPLLAMKALAASKRLGDLQGVCFTGLKSCRDLAVALGLASLGLRVSVAVPLPLWGSEKVRTLLAEKLAAQGGSLTHFDHPAHAQEILEWFLK